MVKGFARQGAAADKHNHRLLNGKFRPHRGSTSIARIMAGKARRPAPSARSPGLAASNIPAWNSKAYVKICVGEQLTPLIKACMIGAIAGRGRRAFASVVGRSGAERVGRR